MTTLRYVHCEDDEMWLGYFEELPDYLTQGESLGELRRTLVISTGTSQAVIKPA
jgi:predicted RNase H-like HicB family nuclease